MLQSLIRNWLLGTVGQNLRGAATQAASEAMNAQRAADASTESPVQDVCHVGLVFALSIESGGLADQLAGVVSTQGAGFVAREGGLAGRRLVLVESGVGRKAAEHATRALIVGHRPKWVISAGFAGGLDEKMELGDIFMPDQIVDESHRQLEIDFSLDREAFAASRHLHLGRLLTVDRIIDSPDEKKTLGARFDALAVDMESMAVAEMCRREKVRFLAVRVISDTMSRALPRDIDYLVKRRTTAARLGAAAGAIVRRPGSIKDMWQLKEDALLCSERLARFLTGIVAQLP